MRKSFVSHVFLVDKSNEIKISYVTCTYDLVGQFGSQATLTNEVNSACDKNNFDFIELVYPKNVGKQKIIFLAPLMAETEMVSKVVKLRFAFLRWQFTYGLASVNANKMTFLCAVLKVQKSMDALNYFSKITLTNIGNKCLNVHPHFKDCLNTMHLIIDEWRDYSWVKPESWVQGAPSINGEARA